MLITEKPKTIRDNYIKIKPYFHSFNLSRKKAIKNTQNHISLFIQYSK